jgi:hypothetical protein
MLFPNIVVKSLLEIVSKMRICSSVGRELLPDLNIILLNIKYG